MEKNERHILLCHAYRTKGDSSLEKTVKDLLGKREVFNVAAWNDYTRILQTAHVNRVPRKYLVTPLIKERFISLVAANPGSLHSKKILQFLKKPTLARLGEVSIPAKGFDQEFLDEVSLRYVRLNSYYLTYLTRQKDRLWKDSAWEISWNGMDYEYITLMLDALSQTNVDRFIDVMSKFGIRVNRFDPLSLVG